MTLKDVTLRKKVKGTSHFRTNKLNRNQTSMAIFYLLPALIPLVVFWFWPMIYSVYISLTNWDFMSPQYNMVGLQNYLNLFVDPNFYQSVFNTLYFCIGVVVPTIAIGLLLAVLLNRKLRARSVYRLVLFSPWVTPTVAVSIVWSWIFDPKNGLANYILSLIHLPALQWASSTTWAMPVIIIVTVWKSVGWTMIFYLGALQKLPKEVYESASLDGAKGWRKFTNVTLPLISPTTFFLIIITTIETLQAYDQIQIMTQGGPAGSTQTILYMYYQSAFQQFNMGQATAVSTILVLVTALLSFVQFTLSKRWVHYQ